MNFFSIKMCLFSKEPVSSDISFEYPSHMFWLRKKKINFQLHIFIGRPEKSTSKLLSIDLEQMDETLKIPKS